MSLILVKWASLFICLAAVLICVPRASAQARGKADRLVVNFPADNPSMDIGSFIKAVKASTSERPGRIKRAIDE